MTVADETLTNRLLRNANILKKPANNGDCWDLTMIKQLKAIFVETNYRNASTQDNKHVNVLFCKNTQLTII